MKSIYKSKITVILSVVILTFCSADTLAAAKLPVVKISGGEAHTLVLGENGQAFACGCNGSFLPEEIWGLLGTGQGWSTTHETELVRVHGPNNIGFFDSIDDIAAGWQHSLALDVDGCVWAFGGNKYGQLGNGESGFELYETIPVRTLSGQQDPCDQNSPLQYIESISAGRSGEHSLAVDANNFCWAWGKNENGQLGINKSGFGQHETTPVQVHGVDNDGNLANIIAVSAGEEHSMALDANGIVWTFGDNAFGKLGDNLVSGSSSSVPVKVHGVNDVNYLENIVAISAGWDHCMALEGYDLCDSNICGKVFCWGNNGIGYYSGSSGGRLGNGQVTDSNSTPVIVLSGEQDPNDPCSYLEGILTISAGESHSMALGADGFVYTWGDNMYSQLGTGDYNDYNTPAKVVAPDRDGDGYSDDLDGDPNTKDYLGDDIAIVAISAGYWHCLAIDQQGTLYTWGQGSSGKLGVGDYENYNIPQKLELYYPPVHNLTKSIDYYEIQTAIDNADSNDVIEADPDTYQENINFSDRALTLQSTNPYNWGTVANTIIDGDGSDVVRFSSNTGSTLTGFTITNGSDGIECSNSQVTIERCIIKENSSSGIYSYNHSPVITNSIIHHNEDHGIYFSNSSSSIQPIITNNWIHNNGTGGSGDGLRLSGMDSTAIVRNNTIVNNDDYGIYLSGTAADINSCIIFNNNSGGTNLYGVSSVDYCCINTDPGGTENTTSDPCLVDVDANNLHLSPGSPCIDLGDPCLAPEDDETDIDNEDRVINDRVDIGADEFYWPKADYNEDQIVNFIDYAMFANNWLDTNDAISLDEDSNVDFDDLELFSLDWLWEAAWTQTEEEMMMCMGGGGGFYKSSAVLELELSKPVLAVPKLVSIPTLEQEIQMIEELIDFMDELWESGELKEYETEAEHFEFRKGLLELLEQLKE